MGCFREGTNWKGSVASWTHMFRGQQLGRLGSRDRYWAEWVFEPSCWRDPHCNCLHMYIMYVLTGGSPSCSAGVETEQGHQCCLCACERSLCLWSVWPDMYTGIYAHIYANKYICGVYICSMNLLKMYLQLHYWLDLGHRATAASPLSGCQIWCVIVVSVCVCVFSFSYYLYTTAYRHKNQAHSPLITKQTKIRLIQKWKLKLNFQLCFKLPNELFLWLASDETSTVHMWKLNIKPVKGNLLKDTISLYKKHTQNLCNTCQGCLQHQRISPLPRFVCYQVTGGITKVSSPPSKLPV